MESKTHRHRGVAGIQDDKSTPSLTVQGQNFVLFAQRGLLWREAQTLIITDPHFGKDAAFRRAGVPVPAGTTAADLARLDAMLGQTGARRLLILGDFFHDRAARSVDTLEQLAAWRSGRRGLEIVLVRGNHDFLAGDPPEEWGFRCVFERLAEPPFVFCHHPERCGAGYVLAGHVHPCVRLTDADGTMLRAACFHFGREQAIVPAFGGFTGKHPVVPRAGDRVFVLNGDEVVEISTEG